MHLLIWQQETLVQTGEILVTVFEPDSLTESVYSFGKRRVVVRLLNQPRFLDPGVQVVGLHAVCVENHMVRMNPGSAVLPIASKKDNLTRLFARQIDQAKREVFREVIALSHENPKLVFAIWGLERHLVALHLAVQAHFATRSFHDLLRASDQFSEFLISEHSHAAKYASGGQAMPSQLSWLAGMLPHRFLSLMA